MSNFRRNYDGILDFEWSEFHQKKIPISAGYLEVSV